MTLKINEISEIVSKEIKSEIATISYVTEGSSSVTHKVESRNGEFFFFKENDDNHELQLEITKQLTRIGVRVPEIISVDKRWMLLRAVDGVNLNEIKDEKIRSKAITEAGRMVAKINSVNVKGFGLLKSVTEAYFKTYEDYYKKLVSKLPQNRRKLVVDYINKVDKSILCHGDIYNSHIYSDKSGEIITIIDLDDMLGASFYYDLAEYDISHKRDPEIWKLFTSGYSTVLPVPEHGSIELIIEEYLILFESYHFTLNKHPEQVDNLNNKKEKLSFLERLIW